MSRGMSSDTSSLFSLRTSSTQNSNRKRKRIEMANDSPLTQQTFAQLCTLHQWPTHTLPSREQYHLRTCSLCQRTYSLFLTYIPEIIRGWTLLSETSPQPSPDSSASQPDPTGSLKDPPTPPKEETTPTQNLYLTQLQVTLPNDHTHTRFDQLYADLSTRIQEQTLLWRKHAIHILQTSPHSENEVLDPSIYSTSHWLTFSEEQRTALHHALWQYETIRFQVLRKCRAIKAYQIFLHQQIQKTKATHTTHKDKTTFTKHAAHWQLLTEEEKRPLIQAATHIRKNTILYTGRLSPWSQNRWKQYNTQLQQTKEHRHTKRPTSAFLRYVHHMWAQQKQNPAPLRPAYRAVLQQCKTQWSQLSVVDRKPYQDETDIAWIHYHQEKKRISEDLKKDSAIYRDSFSPT